MLADVLVGTIGMVGMAAGAAGLWALVMFRRNGSNGKPASGPPAPEPPPTHFVAVPALDELPEKLEQGLRPIFEDFFDRVHEPEAPPEWSARVVEGLEDIRACLAEEPAWSATLIRSVKDLGQHMTAIEAARLSSAPPSASPALLEASKRLEHVGQSLPLRITQSLGELFAAERARSVPKPPPPPPTKNEGRAGTPPPPPRSAPPNLPRMNPGELPATPSIPASYVAGSVFVPAGVVWSLLVLIQKQLSPNCPGSSIEFALAADAANSGPVLVGGASSIGGPLTADNYGYQLAADGPPRLYRSTYPGGNTPVGELQVLAPDGGYLHVEVQA